MRELRIIEWCDPCKAAGEDVEAIDSITFVLDGRARRYDYCAKREHTDPAWSELTALATEDVEANGVAAPRKSTQRAEAKPRPHLRCQLCGRTVQGAQGAAIHARAHHGDVADDWREHFDGLTVRGAPPSSFACPECGKVLGNATGLGIHRRRSHGVRGAQHRPRA